MDTKAKPPAGEHSPLDREVVTATVYDWVNCDCPIAGKEAIQSGLVNLLVDRIMAIKPGNVPGNEGIFPLKKPEAPIVKPEPPKPPDLIPQPPKPPDLIKPPDPIKPPEKPVVKPPELPIAKPKRGMESKRNHAIKRSKPKAKTAKPIHKKPIKHTSKHK